MGKPLNFENPQEASDASDPASEPVTSDEPFCALLINAVNELIKFRHLAWQFIGFLALLVRSK